jgi:hypothetical protein
MVLACHANGAFAPISVMRGATIDPANSILS